VLRLAVEQATLLWGGLYQPIFRPGDAGWIEEVSRSLAVDVLLSLDQAPASEQAADLDGFRWQGHAEWGPLSPAKDYVNHRLLGLERLLGGFPGDSWCLPEWAADDPLNDLFHVWFGAYGTSAQGVNLQSQFAARAARATIGEGAELSADTGSWVTPIAATGSGIEYKGQSPGAAFIIVNPADQASLTTLWNARACGAPVFPIPVGHESRVLAAADAWLRQVMEDGKLDRWTTSDGKTLGPMIHVWGATEADELPAALAELLAARSVAPMTVSPESGLDLAHGWYGDHPFTTGFEESFSQPLEEDGRLARIPLPVIGGGSRAYDAPRGDVVAVHVSIHTVSGVRPDWTFSVPNKRSYARLLREYDGVLLHFERPVPDGRALSASSGSREVVISAVPSGAILGKLLEAPGWSARQTPGGVFVTRLIERLGGATSTLANQPGTRAALLAVARSERGLPSGAIVQAVKNRQGSWPGPLGGDAARYPAAVFHFLLRQAILRPVLPVDCPYCTSSIAFRPEDLATQMKCEMCLREFPLGLALGKRTGGRNDWLYQLAGHVGHDRLNEALPVMATLQLLCTRTYEQEPVIPYLLGWAIKGPQLDCEVDIAAVLDYRGIPALVIGEVKSRLDSIDANDLSNLQKIQHHVRGQGVECFILAAVMRELRDEEVSALRDLAQHPPNTLLTGSALNPVLPIVLTERNLSAEWFGETDHHPVHWSPADGILGLAKESCRTNLGMTGLEPDSDGEHFRFRPLWSSTVPAPAPDTNP
jgi:hypothetical protein